MESNSESHLLMNLHPKKFQNFEEIFTTSASRFLRCVHKDPPNLSAPYLIKMRQVRKTEKNELMIQEQRSIEREIALLAKIRSSSFKPKALPEFFGFYKTESKEWFEYSLVFEYFPISISTYIDDKRKECKPIPLIKIQEFSKDLIEALAFLQSMDITLGDLKPTSLMLTETENVKIIEFASVKETSNKENEEENLSFFNSGFQGNLVYLAPELKIAFQNNEIEKKINPFKCDVYSLGLVLLEVASLKKCKFIGVKQEIEKFVHESLLKFKSNFNNDEGKDKKEVREIIKFLQECLSFEPKERLDFIGLLFKRICEGKKREKIKLHILIENMEYEVVRKLLEKKDGDAQN